MVARKLQQELKSLAEEFSSEEVESPAEIDKLKESIHDINNPDIVDKMRQLDDEHPVIHVKAKPPALQFLRFSDTRPSNKCFIHTRPPLQQMIQINRCPTRNAAATSSSRKKKALRAPAIPIRPIQLSPFLTRLVSDFK